MPKRRCGQYGCEAPATGWAFCAIHLAERIERMRMRAHRCGDECRRVGLDVAHERTRLRMRAKRVAKLHGRRPGIRWTTREIGVQSDER